MLRDHASLERDTTPDVERLSISAVRHVAVLAAALIVWAWSLSRVDENMLGGLGLVGVLPLTAFLAIVTLVVGFVLAVDRDRSGRIPGLYVASLAVAIHGMPALAYEHLRFAWAWKHVGIVDFIQRTGGVDPAIETLPVYHNWPGFFGVNAWITKSSQLDSALSYAAWAPVVFNLLFLVALYVLMETLGSDQRLVWTALLIFVLANWVGQDYFAPQAIALFFYFAVLAMLLRWFTVGSDAGADPETTPGTLPHLVLVGTVTIALGAMAMSHQLTPVMTLVALGALLLFKVIDVRWPLYTLFFFTAAWMIGPAWEFVVEHFDTVVRDIGGFQANLDAGISDLDGVSRAQAAISFAARAITAGIIALAALGWIGRRGRRVPTGIAVVLAVAPIVLILLSSYGDEVVFRAYLFALPFLAWLAASVWFPEDDAPASPASLIALGIVAVTMAGAGLLATFGADELHVFTDSEVMVAEYVYANGVPGSLLVDLSRDYPGQFNHYENFTYLTVDRAGEEVQSTLLADPAGVLARWLENPSYSGGYVLITETMRSSVMRLGTLPAGSADAIESALRASPDFVVAVESGDSVAFELRGRP